VRRKGGGKESPFLRAGSGEGSTLPLQKEKGRKKRGVIGFFFHLLAGFKGRKETRQTMTRRGGYSSSPLIAAEEWGEKEKSSTIIRLEIVEHHLFLRLRTIKVLLSFFSAVGEGKGGKTSTNLLFSGRRGGESSHF